MSIIFAIRQCVTSAIIKIKQSIINFFVTICAILLFSQSAQAEGEPSENFKRHQQYVQDNNIATKLYNSPDAFFKAIIPEQTNKNDERYMLINYMGYSGAGYKTDPIEGESLSSYEKFKQDFKTSVERHYTEALNNDGVMTKLIFMLGGTTDGFGEGYEWIKEFKEEKQQQGKDISKIIVAGMVSDQAASSDISPDQDYLLLVGSYQDESGQSWELKEAKDKPSVMIDLFNHSQIVYVELFGGGAQAEKEILEWLKNHNNIGTKKLILYPGYQSQAQAKDYNAAKQLLANPEIKSEDEKDTTESTNSPIYIIVHTTGSSSLLFIGQYLEQSSPTTVSDAMSASES